RGPGRARVAGPDGLDCHAWLAERSTDTRRAWRIRRFQARSPMSRVVAIFTGGTISMRVDAALGGNVPTLDGAAIIAATPGLDRIADVDIIDLGWTPASHFSF